MSMTIRTENVKARIGNILRIFFVYFYAQEHVFCGSALKHTHFFPKHLLNSIFMAMHVRQFKSNENIN